MSLRNTQAVFYDAISKPAGDDSEVLAVELIKKTGNLSALQRLDIYRNTSLVSKISALQQIYPVCESILGSRVFKNLAYDYAMQQASYSNDLNGYGALFAAFIDNALQTHHELVGFNYLHDLCTLEWLWHKAYYQANDSVFDFVAFALHSDKPAEVSLNISYSLEIMTSDYPVHLIWQQYRDQNMHASVAGLDETEYLCIYRHDFIPKIEKINQAEFALLNACRQGRTLEDMASDEALLVALSLMPEMIKRAWICGFNHHSEQVEQHV